MRGRRRLQNFNGFSGWRARFGPAGVGRAPTMCQTVLSDDGIQEWMDGGSHSGETYCPLGESWGCYYWETYSHLVLSVISAVGPWMGSSFVTSGRLLYLSEPWKSPSEPKAMTLLELVKKHEDKCRS